jgi:hypothetical protein
MNPIFADRIMKESQFAFEISESSFYIGVKVLVFLYDHVSIFRYSGGELLGPKAARWRALAGAGGRMGPCEGWACDGQGRMGLRGVRTSDGGLEGATSGETWIIVKATRIRVRTRTRQA